MINLLFTIDHWFFIKLRSSLIDQINILTMKKNQFQRVKGFIGPYTYAATGEGRITQAKEKIKKSIIGKWKDPSYDRKSMIRSKNRFLKTDQLIMIENQFLIGITMGWSCRFLHFYSSSDENILVSLQKICAQACDCSVTTTYLQSSNTKLFEHPSHLNFFQKYLNFKL